MKPVTKSQYIKLVQSIRPMLESIDTGVECATNFATEFGAVVMLHGTDGKITMGIVVNGIPVGLFDYSSSSECWTKRGEEVLGYWLTREIYECGMRLAELAKEAAK